MNAIDSQMEIFLEEPEDFQASVEVGAVYVYYQERFLFLQRCANKSEGGRWGVVAGKLEENESPIEGAYRELEEESALVPDDMEQLESMGKLYVKDSGCDFIFHMFLFNLDKEVEILLSVDEHQDYKWVNKEEALQLELMNGAVEALEHAITYIDRKSHSQVFLSTYLILRKENQVLLSLRKNTGYMDGFYGLVSGHVDEGEGAGAGMVREAAEEAGIAVLEEDLRLVHTMHRRTTRNNIDLFYECWNWEKEITNKEPHKCEKLQFFPIDQMPSNTIDYIADGVRMVEEGVHYSERGWD
ncbi:MAG: hypothetical protein CMO81_08350 [Waddliaceae bacterium]|nr:hypothetical protein [Waddliaceae bacterium]